jgi:hypothetical protein
MPRIMPEPRYFSIPSIELGAELFRNRALNCWPWARSVIHSPDAVIHSPAEMMAAWPTMVTRSRWPRAFARSTQNPFSALWTVTRSTRPARTSWVDDSGVGFMRALYDRLFSHRAPLRGCRAGVKGGPSLRQGLRRKRPCRRLPPPHAGHRRRPDPQGRPGQSCPQVRQPQAHRAGEGGRAGAFGMKACCESVWHLRANVWPE